MGQPSLDIPPAKASPQRRLDSWKEIAGYLNRDITTVQRWEKREGMPVHRHLHDKRGSVYAIAGELDAWVESRRPRAADAGSGSASDAGQPDLPDALPATTPQRKASLRIGLAALAALCLTAAVWFALRHRGAPSLQPRIRSLAVLPLRNLSGDPTQDYLADGITEALIGRLASVRELRVISHTSVMRFKNPQLSSPEIARQLNVDALVEGSVIREGSRIRVTAQLIRGATDEHFWSQTYDREMRDALAIESDLAQAIADKVEVTITGDEHRRLSAAHPVAPEVYESYLKGNFSLNNGPTRADVEKAIQYFDDSIAKDPAFAPAWVGAAEAYTRLGLVFSGGNPSQTRPQVIRYAQQALKLDPDLVEAHVLLANVQQEEWQWESAESEYRRALELTPDNADALAGLALWLACEGRTDEAVADIERARALAPLDISGAQVAWILFLAHRFDEATRELHSALAVEPDSPMDLWHLGFALTANNQAEDAIPPLERAASMTQRNPAVLAILIRAYAHAGRRTDALRLLDQLKARRKNGYVPAAAFVNAYLGLGDREQVFFWLEEAYREKSNILQFVKVHPYFDPIRSDPRFADLVRRVGLD